jgi:3-oxoacyl-[acyl-carrier protein] reductase|tara:strand:- start:1864 stop:2649 length:786 start_codon:yes stop_codon:yes gene_type:complete
MEINLKGKNALVGGSSKGIGRAIADRLAASGANLTLMARSEKLLKEIVDKLDRSLGQQHHYLVVDFSNFPAFAVQMESYFEEHSVDILINNTQGPAAGGALDKTIGDYQSAFDLLFKCAVHTSSLALPHMQKQQWGRIVNVSSISVKEPLNYLALSNSLRAALVSWAKSLAIDIAKDNITINNTLTGYFDTERIAQLNAQKSEKMGIPASEVRSTMEASVPMNRIGKPEEYANVVCFLVSEQASYITGANIPIDGGLLKSL